MKRIQLVRGVPALIEGDTGEILEIPFWKTPYNFDFDQEVKETSTIPDPESKTDQTFTDDSDINTIVKKIGLGLAVVEPLNPAQFGVQNKMTYVEMQAHLAEHRAHFYNLPPDVREEFQNDPARWSDQVVEHLKSEDFEALERIGIDLTELKDRKAKAQADAQAQADAAALQAAIARTERGEVTPPPDPPKKTASGK